MGKKLRKPVTAPSEGLMASESAELPERWSVQRKTEVVVRLLRGEALDAVSRESQVPAHELESWKRVFLNTGTRGLRTRAETEERELTLARAKIGELMMRLELAEHSSKKVSMKRCHPPSRDRDRHLKERAMYSIGVDFHKAYSHEDSQH